MTRALILSLVGFLLGSAGFAADHHKKADIIKDKNLLLDLSTMASFSEEQIESILVHKKEIEEFFSPK